MGCRRRRRLQGSKIRSSLWSDAFRVPDLSTFGQTMRALCSLPNLLVGVALVAGTTACEGPPPTPATAPLSASRLQPPTPRVVVHRRVAGTLVPDLEETDVRLTLVQPLILSTGVEGFELYVEYWDPRAEISFYLIGPSGERVPIVPAERHTRVGDTGKVVLEGAYALPGLHPGRWMAAVAGTSVVHQFTVEIPRLLSDD